VGAGAGSVSRWLAKRVGPTGKVVATDIDTRFLTGMSLPNLEIRQQDIIKGEEEIAQFDLVHCRAVLQHLSDPQKGAGRMANAIRPSGWMLIEEFDYGSVLSADVTNPSAIVFTTTIRALCEYLRRAGIADGYFGRRVPGILEHLGLIDVDQEGWSRMYRGGEAMARFSAGTLRVTAKHMIAAGLLTQEQYDSAQQMFLDPAFIYPGLTMFAAWGRRPGNPA
jgi:SAM-dependent methyltransferase